MGGNLHRKCYLRLRIALFMLISGRWGQCSSRVLGYVLVGLMYFSPSRLNFSQHLRHLSEPLDIMYSEDLSSRPSASEALDCVRRLALSHDFTVRCSPAGKFCDVRKQLKKPHSEWI